MVTIQADNYDELIKQARKEKRQANKQAKINKANRELAYSKAYASLGYIVSRLMDDDVSCHYWSNRPKIQTISENTYKCRFEAEDGYAEAQFYKVKPYEVLLNGAGFCLAVHVDEGTTGHQWYAIGIHAGIYAFTVIPKKIVNLIDEYLAQKALDQQ